MNEYAFYLSRFHCFLFNSEYMHITYYFNVNLGIIGRIFGKFVKEFGEVFEELGSF